MLFFPPDSFLSLAFVANQLQVVIIDQHVFLLEPHANWEALLTRVRKVGQVIHFWRVVLLRVSDSHCGVPSSVHRSRARQQGIEVALNADGEH